MVAHCVGVVEDDGLRRGHGRLPDNLQYGVECRLGRLRNVAASAGFERFRKGERLLSRLPNTAAEKFLFAVRVVLVGNDADLGGVPEENGEDAVNLYQRLWHGVDEISH